MSRMSPASLASTEPTVWTNPWAERPLTLKFPWRCQEIAPDGRITAFLWGDRKFDRVE